MEPAGVTYATPLNQLVCHITYNVTHTCMATCTHEGQITSWVRDPPKREWEATATWQLEDLDVTCMCMAGPEFGNVICIGTLQGVVCFWSERPGEGTWTCRSRLAPATKAATAAEFAPSCHGPLVAVTFDDGCVRTFLASDVMDADRWDLHAEFRISTSKLVSARSLSWRKGSEDNPLPPMLCVGHSSGEASLWIFREQFLRWECTANLGNSQADDNTLDEEVASVADVAWAPPLGRSFDLIAVAQGQNVMLWELRGSSCHPICKQIEVIKHDHSVWQLDWNWLGTWLGASTEGGEVWMWRPDFTGAWACQNKICGENREMSQD